MWVKTRAFSPGSQARQDSLMFFLSPLRPAFSGAERGKKRKGKAAAGHPAIKWRGYTPLTRGKGP